MTPALSDLWWSPALTLAERARAWRSMRRPVAPPSASAPAGGSTATGANRAPSATAGVPDDTRASAHVDRWKTQPPFQQPDTFARRLALETMSESEFREVLMQPPGVLAALGDGTPDWVAEAEHASHAVASTSTAGDDATGLEVVRALAEPFVVRGLNRLLSRARAVFAEHPSAPFDAREAVRQFEPYLWSIVAQRCVKVAILELNVARVCGTLAGNTPRERYAHFVRQLAGSGLRARIVDEYPVLARQLVSAVHHWETFATEFLAHLAEDAAALDALHGKTLGPLVDVTPGAGDVHRHGRTVVIARFASGTRVVYKPRGLAVDRCFERLIAWLNARGQHPALRVVRTLDRATHGWAEYVTASPCGSPEELAAFYARFGAYLAILHALEATDFHYENVIACGEHPMLIDLEALFHPRLTATSEATDPAWIGWTALHHSVLRSGVLPFRSFATDESSGLDISALGGTGGQRTPNRVSVLADAGTDEMHLVREHAVLPASTNRPALGGQLADPGLHVAAILEGFTATYRVLMAHRDALLASDGPIHAFATAPIRAVLRPTRQYALILGESYHPDLLRNALDRDRHLDRLWVAVPHRPELQPVVQYEHADLTVGDVPLFTSRPASRDLFTTHGDRVPDYFAQSGLDAALARIASLSEADLLQQRWVIRASFAGLARGGHGAVALPDEPTRRPSAPTLGRPRSDECIDAALRVARRLGELALRRDDRVAWLGLTLVRERDWVIQPIGADLYGGSLGIALFLGYVAHITGVGHHAELARTIVRQLFAAGSRRAEEPASPMAPASIGAFGPIGGAVYVLAHLGVLWGDGDLLDCAEEIALRASAELAGDRQLDVIGGAAGLVLAACALRAALPAGRTDEVIAAGAARVLAAAQRTDAGLCWTTRLDATHPLTGASHGAAGMAMALAAAAAAMSNAAYADAALDALRYERSTYDPSHENWPDYRILDRAAIPEAPSYMWAWCHGAPGIGLARLAVMQHLSHPDLQRDLEAALRSTAAYGFGGNDSLCHGDLGNLDLLLTARERGFDGAWTSRLAHESSRLVERLARGEWRCGIPGGLETPGLMMGLAGIGYGLLRLGAADRVPSLLSLEAPRVPCGAQLER